MKLRLSFISLLLLAAIAAAAQDKYQLSGDFSGLNFSQFASKVETMLPVKFFFREEWVGSIRVASQADCRNLDCFLDRTLQGTSLFYYIDDAGNVVLTRNYAVKRAQASTRAEKAFLPPTEYGSSGDTQVTGTTSYTEIGNPADRNKPGTVALTGYITNRDTKEPVAGVTVYIQKLSAGTVSNEYGFYTLTLPRGMHLLQFSFIGMKEKQVNLNLYGPGELNIDMTSTLIPLKETVVSAQKSVTLQRFEVGAEKINIQTFKLLPAALGDADIIKSVLMIPGVQSVGEGSSGFNVRGGSADQNLILLYGAPVYNASHFFGFFSGVNSDIIRDVTLYKGGIPGRYGGRISSVLDITSKDGNRREFAGNAGISPITAHAMIEGPIIKDTLMYILTGRTTYSNWVLDLFDNQALQNSKASFSDLNAKITWEPDKKNRFELAGYYSRDAFSFNSDTTYSYNNNIVSLKWRHFFTNRFLSNFSVSNSHYEYDISSTQVAEEAFRLAHKINTSSFKADFNWFQGRNEVNFGADLFRHVTLPGSYSPVGDSSLVVPDIIENEQAWEGALYVDDKFLLTSNLSVNAGIRFSGFISTGPGSEFIYDPAYSRARSTITDTILYGKGDIISKYAGPEYRLSMNLRLNNRSSLKLNYNKTRQYLHLLSNSTSISPTDTWKLSDNYLKPQVGDQVAIGYYRMLKGSVYEASAEAYYKRIKNMVDFKGGTSLIMNEDVEKDVINMDGRAYGVELVFKKLEGKVRYSLGYTYARTLVRSLGTWSDELINGGSWFPSSFDKPHDLNVTFNYLFSRRYSFSSSYTYSTGRPITYPVATYRIGDKILIHYSDRNKYRIPDYSRLDVALRVSGNLKSRRIAHPNWIFSVYNLLGRANVYSVYFKNDANQIKGYKLSVFGQAIPTVTFNFDF